MTAQLALNPQTIKNPETIAYENLLQLCPTMAKLKQDEFVILKSRFKAAPEITIGCKHPESIENSGIYEIGSQHGETKVYTTIEVSHTKKFALALTYETKKDNQKKIVEASEQRLIDLLNNLKNRGYTSEVSQKLCRA